MQPLLSSTSLSGAVLTPPPVRSAASMFTEAMSFTMTATCNGQSMAGQPGLACDSPAASFRMPPRAASICQRHGVNKATSAMSFRMAASCHDCVWALFHFAFELVSAIDNALPCSENNHALKLPRIVDCHVRSVPGFPVLLAIVGCPCHYLWPWP